MRIEQTYLEDAASGLNQFFALNQVILEAYLSEFFQSRLENWALRDFAQLHILTTTRGLFFFFLAVIHIWHAWWFDFGLNGKFNLRLLINEIIDV